MKRLSQLLSMLLITGVTKKTRMKSMKLFVAFTAMFLPVLANADPVEIDKIWYNLNEENHIAEVRKNPNGYSGDIIIPTEITYQGNKYTVTSIGDNAFYSCFDLISVTIPNSVTSIGDKAFACNTSKKSHLTSVNIPESVTSIGEGAFDLCSSLTSITIPKSVKSIGSCLFYGCSSLTSVYISDITTWLNMGFTIVRKSWDYDYGDPVCFYEYDYSSNPLTHGAHLFLNGEEIQDLVIPEGVTSIPRTAFYGCNISSVTIPKSLKSIGYKAFYGCKLKSVNISDISTWLNIDFEDKMIKSYSDAMEEGPEYEIDYSSNPLRLADEGHLYIDGQEIKDLVIPNSVTDICDYAFYYHKIT